MKLIPRSPNEITQSEHEQEKEQKDLIPSLEAITNLPL